MAKLVKLLGKEYNAKPSETDIFGTVRIPGLTICEQKIKLARNKMKGLRPIPKMLQTTRN